MSVPCNCAYCCIAQVVESQNAIAEPGEVSLALARIVGQIATGNSPEWLAAFDDAVRKTRDECAANPEFWRLQTAVAAKSGKLM